MRSEIRLPDKIAVDAKALVGYYGHKSFNDVLVKALEAYIRLNEKELKAIRRGK